MIIDHRKLHALTNRIVAAGGSSPAEAAIVAEHLVEANLRGHDSHGVGCWSPMYATSKPVR